MRRRKLTDGMPHQIIRTHAPALDEPEQRYLQSKQSGLGIESLIQQVSVGRSLANLPSRGPKRCIPRRHIRKQHPLQRIPQMPIQLTTHPVQRIPKNRERLIKLPTHTHTLRTLPRKEKGQRALTFAAPPHHTPGELSTRECPESTQKHLPITSQHHPTMLEHRTSSQRSSNIQQLQLGITVDTVEQPPRLITQRRLALRREYPRHHPDP